MKIQLVTPAPLRINNGNKITALRWAGILKGLGHRVRVTREYDGRDSDVLIALHARRSADSIRRFHDRHPQRPLVVALTGTDLYRDIRRDPEAQQSLELATRVVALQRQALQELRKAWRDKTQVIYQSAEPLAKLPERAPGRFIVCLIAHLRDEKDSLRAAYAVRRLPPESCIQVVHVGVALNGALEKRARVETERNPRYRWTGQLSHRRTRLLLARSHLACITSKMEGSSNVLSEALASGVPVIATRIPGLIGTLEENYPGYFPVGDTDKLRRLLLRAENDAGFYGALKRHCARAARLIQPEREAAAWRKLLRELAA